MQIHEVELSTLVEDEKNARTHPKKNMQAIVSSLSQFGQVEPLVVQRKTNKVIGGNGRLAAMKQLGWTSAQAILLDIDDTKAIALGLALNRTSDLAEWDYGQLSELIQTVIDDNQIPIVELGWEDFEVEQILGADWSPPEVSSSYVAPKPTKEDGSAEVTIELSFEQAEKLRLVADGDPLSDAVEMLCDFFLEQKRGVEE